MPRPDTALQLTLPDQPGSSWSEHRASRFLAEHGIPVVPGVLATDPESAVHAAGTLGYPVVVKLLSETITHKTDVGGVQLNLRDAESVRQAFRAIRSAVGQKAGAGHFQGVSVQPMVVREGYELILGSTVDDQFGPVLLFGAGGALVEVFQDRALALPPLNTTLARRMMEQTKVFAALQGVRGRRTVDITALEEMLLPAAEALQNAAGRFGLTVPYQRARALFLTSSGKEEN